MSVISTVQNGELWTVQNSHGSQSKETFLDEVSAADYGAQVATRTGATLKVSGDTCVEALHVRWQIEGSQYAAAGFPSDVCWNAYQFQGWQARSKNSKGWPMLVNCNQDVSNTRAWGGSKA